MSRGRRNYSSDRRPISTGSNLSQISRNYKVVSEVGNNIEIISNNIQNGLIDKSFVDSLHGAINFRVGNSVNVNLGGVSRVDRLGSLNSNFTNVSGGMGGIFKKLVKIEFEFEGLRPSSIAGATQFSELNDNQIIYRIRSANKVKGLLVFETSIFGNIDIDSRQIAGGYGGGNMRLSQFQFNFEGFIEPPKLIEVSKKKSSLNWLTTISLFLMLLSVLGWIYLVY